MFIYIHRNYVEKKNEEVVPFYHMSYLIYFYDIYVTFQKRYQNKFDLVISNYIENSTSYTLVQLFHSFNVFFRFCTGFNTEAIWTFVMKSQLCKLSKRLILTFLRLPPFYALQKCFDGRKGLTRRNLIIYLTNIVIIKAFKFVMNKVH